MRIGLTYDLQTEYLAQGFSAEDAAEFDREETIVAIGDALAELGHEPVRIGGAFALCRRLVAGERWDLVFNVAEGVGGISRELQVPALLELYGVPCTFSEAVVLGLCLHKGHTKRLVRDAGLPTPDFLVVDSLLDLAPPFPGPYFAKPVAEGTSKGVSGASLVPDASGLPAICAQLLERFRQPVLVEAFLPGREFTVGLLGTGAAARVLGTLAVDLRAGAEPGAYSYHNKQHYEDLVDYSLAPPDDPRVAAAATLALAAWRVLGCRDAGRLDLRCDPEGRPQFIEVNPLAGLDPVKSDLPILCRLLGLPYRELIGAIVASAVARVPTAEVHDAPVPVA